MFAKLLMIFGAIAVTLLPFNALGQAPKYTTMPAQVLVCKTFESASAFHKYMVKKNAKNMTVDMLDLLSHPKCLFTTSDLPVQILSCKDEDAKFNNILMCVVEVRVRGAKISIYSIITRRSYERLTGTPV